jgi:hypothetical protein
MNTFVDGLDGIGLIAFENYTGLLCACRMPHETRDYAIFEKW